MNARLKAINDPTKLSGPERAAVVLLALGVLVNRLKSMANGAS